MCSVVERQTVRKALIVVMPSPKASRRNLAKVKRPRSTSASVTIKLLIWQSEVESSPKPTQRQLARQLGVSQPYVCKTAKRCGTEGMPTMLANPEPVTFEDWQGRGGIRRLTCGFPLTRF